MIKKKTLIGRFHILHFQKTSGITQRQRNTLSIKYFNQLSNTRVELRSTRAYQTKQSKILNISRIHICLLYLHLCTLCQIFSNFKPKQPLCVYKLFTLNEYPVLYFYKHDFRNCICLFYRMKQSLELTKQLCDRLQVPYTLDNISLPESNRPATRGRPKLLEQLKSLVSLVHYKRC